MRRRRGAAGNICRELHQVNVPSHTVHLIHKLGGTSEKFYFLKKNCGEKPSIQILINWDMCMQKFEFVHSFSLKTIFSFNNSFFTLV